MRRRHAAPQAAYRDLRFAKVDLHRVRRRGFPEVVLARGKTAPQVSSIARVLWESGSPVLITKVPSATARHVLRELPQLKHFPEARIIAGPFPKNGGNGRKAGDAVWVVTAGTGDIPVAEEAVVTLRLMGRRVERLLDVGVAGIHRLVRHLPKLRRARAIVVVAGMDGALPSVVSGLVACPVVAVPTSIGYGASFKGIAPLLTMLNSCSPGVAVVNVDNGFGAGYLAGMIAGTDR
ncbi:MAG: nickel pincer cofactor biosynthesis protein LarB [Candidatus Omnitrophica bacterium]|nr:nickel pincer cofactor biosynthesis protein LarB [Candidatus Omnitrophota bacterium]